MTMSDWTCGLMTSGSPPRSLTASRMVARSTMQGTPVKSCMITRDGVNWISWLGSAFGSQSSRVLTCSSVMLAPSMLRTRFSTSTFSEYGR